MKLACFVLFISSIVSCLMAKIVVLPDERIFEIPDPHMISYILEEESPASLTRLYILSRLEPHATLLCPKGYSIQEMRQELVVNKTFFRLIPRSILKEQIISLHDFEQNDDFKKALCPTAYHCLGYQACIFTYSNDLCQRERIPLLPEFFVLSIGCYRDDLFDVPKKFRKNKDFVLYIHYSPNGKIPERGFSLSNLTHVESPEETVFNGQCPPLGVAKKEGYFGNCVEYLPPSNVVSLQLWSAVGKVSSQNCRTKIIQTLCALYYNSQGLCIPPVYQNDKDSKDKKFYNFLVLPEHKYSFSLMEYKKFLSMKIPTLIPARLAFMIMTKKNVKGTISLIQSIYREYFLYVVHIDKEETQLREELQRLIEKSFPSRHNIILLPLESSFSTSYDSYETVRAKMEGYEELLHLGIWDFVITLREDDVSLRNVDDLSMALAPHRGLSFLPDLHIMKKTKRTPVVSCGGLVHEFPSLSNTFRTKSDLLLYNSSDNGVLSRDFVEYLVDENKHSEEINEQQFFLQTLQNSYSSYIPTILMNSPFKHLFHIAPMRALKKHLIKNTVMENNQTEGNFTAFGEDKIWEREYFLEQDVSLLNKLAHSFFFGQKLSNSLKDDAQKFAIQLSSGGYYQHLEKIFPMPVLRYLLEETLKNISAELKVQAGGISLENVLNLQTVPSLVPHQEFCRSKLLSYYTEYNIDYNYWLDVSTYFKNDGRQRNVRIMLQSLIKSKSCFNSGNLRMISLFPWYLEDNLDASSEWSNVLRNVPVPYFSSDLKGVVINIIVVDEALPFIERGNLIKLKGKNGPIELKLSLHSAKDESATTRCFESTKIVVSEKSNAYSIRDDASKKDLLAKLHTVFLSCKNMDTGFWTLKISQAYPRNSKEYDLQFYVLDLQNQYTDEMSKDIGFLWTLKHYAFVTQNDSYDFYSDEIKQSSNFVHLRDSKKKLNITRKGKVLELNENTGFKRKSDKIYFFICGGGLVSSFAVLLTVIVLFCGWRYRFHPKMVLCFVSMLCLITGFQIITIVSVCN